MAPLHLERLCRCSFITANVDLACAGGDGNAQKKLSFGMFDRPDMYNVLEVCVACKSFASCVYIFAQSQPEIFLTPVNVALPVNKAFSLPFIVLEMHLS